MNLVNSHKIKKGLRSINKLYIVSFIFLIATALCGWWAYKVQSKNPTPISMNSAILDNKTSTYAEIEVASIPYVFAEYDNTSNKYYFVLDKENLMYIVYLSKSQYQKLDKEDIEQNPITIKGMTKTIPEDVKKIAIEVYNEDIKENALTESNFEKYVGSIYLNTLESPNDNFIQILLSILSLIISISLCAYALITNKKSKNNIQSFNNKEWQKIESELESTTCIGYENYKLYFSENYVANLKLGVDIFAYSDILWMYPHIVKQYGITTNKSIIIVTKDKKRHQIYSNANLTKKAKKLHEDIMKFLLDKNPKITVGYTSENIQQMKDIYGIK